MLEFKESPTLIAETEKYYIFTDPKITPFGVFFAEIVNELFELWATDQRLVLEVHSSDNLPVVRVDVEVNFKGKINNWDGIMSCGCASLCLTILLQKHLVFTFSREPEFKNQQLLEDLVHSSSFLKNNADKILSPTELQTLYYFLD